VTAPRIVACPTCGAPVSRTPESKFRPFCSERCRTIDLATWANESYRIPVVERDEEDEPGPPPEK
jgi:endogenous inhibitor of DNA gyrase (YacG/DUF329 family)